MKKFMDFISESVSPQLKNDALQFIKKYLNIKANIVLNHKPTSYNNDILGTDMASVGFSNNGTFTINIDFNDTKFGFVRRLAHELVHVKQIEDGRLKKVGNDISFDNVIYTKDEYDKLYHSDTLPKFEEEAFNDERTISNMYWNNTENGL